MAWTYTYDINTPDGSVDNPAEADDRIREIKGATQEKEDVDHYWPLTGTEVSDTDGGEHRKITLRTLTAVVVAALTATKAYLYRLITDGELYFKDASGNTIKLTSGGKILSASLDMKDEDNMVSNSAVHASTQQSIKAYADAVAAASTAAIAAAIAAYVTLSAYTTKDSEDNTMLKTHAYKAATSGLVDVYASLSSMENMQGYVGDTDNPSGAGTKIREVSNGAGGSQTMGLGFSVAKDEYFEITTNSTATPNIRWRSFGTLSKPVDNN